MPTQQVSKITTVNNTEEKRRRDDAFSQPPGTKPAVIDKIDSKEMQQKRKTESTGRTSINDAAEIIISKGRKDPKDNNPSPSPDRYNLGGNHTAVIVNHLAQ